MTFEVAKRAVGIMVLLLTVLLLLTPLPLSNFASVHGDLSYLACLYRGRRIVALCWLSCSDLIGIGSAAVRGAIVSAVLISTQKVNRTTTPSAAAYAVSKVSIGMDGNDGPVTELDAVLPPRPSQALIINRGGMAAEDLFDALTSSRARLTDRYQADHENLKRLKRKKCEAKRDAYHRARSFWRRTRSKRSRWLNT
jgi:hypothetical protein